MFKLLLKYYGVTMVVIASTIAISIQIITYFG